MILFIGINFGLRAQDVGLEWAKSLTSQSNLSNFSYAVSTDANKNVYVSGLFHGTMDVDPGPGVVNITSNPPNTANDAYIVKLDPYGNYLWAKQIGSGTGEDAAYGLEVDASGNVYVMGGFSGTVDMNPGAGVNNLVAVGPLDGFVLKLDSNGNYIWAQRMGGPNGDYAFNMALDPAGDLLVTGYIGDGVATFGGLSVTSGGGGYDGFVTKLSSAGAFQWVKRIGGTGVDFLWGVDVDAAGNIYVNGGVGGPATGLVNLAAAGGYVVKMDPSGNVVWSHVDADVQYYRDLKLDSQGNIYSVTGYAGDVNFVKLDPSGTRLFGQKIGDGVAYMAIGPDDNIYLAGYLSGTTTVGGTTLTSNGGVDILVARVDAAGNVVWVKSMGGPGDDRPYWISADDAGEILVSGLFNNTVDFDPSTCENKLSTGGTTNLASFVFKLTEKALPDGLTVNPGALSPMSQLACSLGIPEVISGTTAAVTAPAGYSNTLSYQWQKSTSASGPWVDMPGETFKDLQPLASSEDLYYKRLVKAKTVFCTYQTVAESAVATVTVSNIPAPTANADGPQWFVCGAGTNVVTLNGSAVGGAGGYMYQWYQGSSNGGTALVATASLTTPAVTQSTTFTLKVTDAVGCIDTDQVTIVPAVANAGPDLSFCQGSGGSPIGTAPVASPSVKYAWSIISGTAGSLSCTTCAQPIANPSASSVYRLTVTTTRKDGTTCITTDDVTVAPVAAPGGVTAFAGNDQTICINSTVQLGSTTDASYSYTWTTGQFLSDTRVARPIFTAGALGIEPCAINYTVTAVKDGCAFVDEVNVSVLNSQTADTDEVECGPRWIEHEGFSNCPQAVYTWSIVSGDGVILQTRNGGEDAYVKSNVGTTRFRRTVTLNGVSCFSDMDIIVCVVSCDVEIGIKSEQGCPKVFPGEELILTSKMIIPDDWNFKWTPANLVDNSTAQEVRVVSTSPATLTLTITSKYDPTLSCSESIDLNPAGWAKPSVVIPDKSICFDSPTAIGSAVASGFAYTWSPALGLDNASSNDPLATLMSDQQYIVQIEESASGCMTTDTVQISVAQVIVDAGVDRTVCNGATVTLGAAAPAGTNWNYSWQPSGAAWTNGTNANMAQPQVEFSGAGSQTFTLTVTDPVSGCSATDEVVLKNSFTPGEYSGAASTICQGEQVQLGKAPIPGATYLWTGAGLSCTTCSNPVATPTTTTTYNLEVSYPGCSGPTIDEVTVTVNQIPNLTLSDVFACGAGAQGIGYGAPGQPAAPVGATYLWSPSTGLSSATAANPTLVVTERRTYSVVVTLANGCTFSDDLEVIPTADAGPDGIVCAGEATVIGTPEMAGATYSWTGAGIVGAANIARPTVKPTATTTYTVSVTVNGCTRTDNVVISVNSAADFNISGNTTICEGGSTVLSLVGAPAASTTWQWSPLAGVATPTATSTQITPTATSTYRLTQTNLGTGCSNFKEVIVVVNPNTISANASPLAVCSGEPVAMPLNVTSSGSYQYVWSPATGLSNAYIANPTVTTGSNRTYNVVVTDLTSNCQLNASVPVTVKSAAACLPPVKLSGNVFHDGNALKDGIVNTTVATPIPSGLFVTLVDKDGAPVRTVAVNTDGTYDFGLVDPASYSIVMHQNPSGSTTPSLPASWMNTGEFLGTGAGNDSGVNGILTNITVSATDVTNANFGVQQTPTAEPHARTIAEPQVGDMIVLNGSLPVLSGSDPEDMSTTGPLTGRIFIVTSLPTNTTLLYDGVPVQAGVEIPNYDPAKLVVEITNATIGATGTSFSYSFVDQAGVPSPPALYTLDWVTPLPVILANFGARVVEQAVELSWTTTAETNSDRFEVEHSTNGKQWALIGNVKSRGGLGITETYHFMHQQGMNQAGPADGDNLYRLKMIDSDQTFAYSRIRSILVDTGLKLTTFPNPANDRLFVNHVAKVVEVVIHNVSGHQMLKTRHITAEGFDISQFKAGAYTVTLKHADGTQRSEKIVISH